MPISKDLSDKIAEIASLEEASLPRLPRDFFTRDGITAAKELLGKILVHHTKLGPIRGIITEVESYMGEEDKGSHTYGGRRTERTEPMYHIGGTSYVYLIYGMYSCMNIAVMTEGIPQAVLLRSVVPADEASRQRMIELRCAPRSSKTTKNAKQARNTNNASDAISIKNAGNVGNTNLKNPANPADASQTAKNTTRNLLKHLSDGPGKMCIAMDITRADNDIDMVESDTFYVTEGIAIPSSCIKAGKRIGIDYAEEAADYLWRFYLE